MLPYRRVTSISYLSRCFGAIISALRSAPDASLDEANIGQEVQKLGFLLHQIMPNVPEWLLNWESRVNVATRLKPSYGRTYSIFSGSISVVALHEPNLEQLGLLAALQISG